MAAQTLATAPPNLVLSLRPPRILSPRPPASMAPSVCVFAFSVYCLRVREDGEMPQNGCRYFLCAMGRPELEYFFWYPPPPHQM